MSDEKSNITRRQMVQGLNASWIARGAAPFLAAVEAAAFGAAPEGVAGPMKFREIENSWIPMRDGVKLAARIWLPEVGSTKRVPAIFNYCPYYARFLTRPEDDARFPYYASHGYACVRVDIRGSGNSEGRPQDEYVKQEQDDALEIIAWIAKQRWCSGAVGMEGLSWSGFNSLQVAARRPPALKAILTHCSTDDRYVDDAHYKGGCVVSDMFGWGTVFLACQGQAQDPAIVGEERWRERWLERLNAIEFNLGNWMTHPDRDAFWKHASVIEDYSRITCPVYAVGGWVDAYKNAVFRLLAGLKVPRKGLVGPWTHVYPHEGIPGPAIGYLDEALRWWDRWLKGIDTGIMQEPMLRVWMQDAAPSSRVPDVPGRWAAEDAWPSSRIQQRRLFLNAPQSLDDTAAVEQRIDLAPIQTIGGASGNWCPSGAGAAQDLAIEMARDQRIDDARSLTFDTAPLSETLEILGIASLELELAIDKPVGYVIARLNDVALGGESGRVSYGVLNLCHRDSMESPSRLEPGKRYKVRLPLDNCAHSFRPGHRIRVSLSTTYWPMVLPSPEATTLSVFTGSCRLLLPVRPLRSEDAALRPFGPPYVPPIAISPVSSEPGSRRVEFDVATGKQVIHHRVGVGVAKLDAIDTLLVGDTNMRYEINENDPNSVTECEYVIGWERGKWAPRVVASSKTSTTPAEFIVTGKLDAFDGEEKLLTRTWEKRIPRKTV